MYASFCHIYFSYFIDLGSSLHHLLSWFHNYYTPTATPFKRISTSVLYLTITSNKGYLDVRSFKRSTLPSIMIDLGASYCPVSLIPTIRVYGFSPRLRTTHPHLLPIVCTKSMYTFRYTRPWGQYIRKFVRLNIKFIFSSSYSPCQSPPALCLHSHLWLIFPHLNVLG